MTNQEIYNIFRKRYPQIAISDYRPLSNSHRPKGQGITLWTDNGDMILYFPKDISIIPLDDIVEYYVKNNIHEISQWVDDGDPCTLTCGKCGYRVARYNNTKFCPNCGARTEEGEQ